MPLDTAFQPGASAVAARSPRELAKIVQEYAASAAWVPQVRFRADGRWYQQVFVGPDYDVWLISWLPGQGTGFHDHGQSVGAFVVATGSLEEQRPRKPPLPVTAGEMRAFGPDYIHDVRNASAAPAVSIHAYSPPLTEMNEYEDGGAERRSRADHTPGDRGSTGGDGKRAIRETRQTIDDVLAAARARLRRLSAADAHQAATQGAALLVDIRPEKQRAEEGSIPGALVIERNVLEWRLDPACEARLPIADRYDLPVVVFCSEGYTSSLASASLQELGLWRATDVDGGFMAWKAAGLPVA